MGENRWQKFKQWWITNDPDDVAREEFRLAAERHDPVTVADRLRSTIVVEPQRAVAERQPRRHHLA